jgi:hypothetical protein
VPGILQSDLDAIGTRDTYDDDYFGALFAGQTAAFLNGDSARS